MIFYTYQWKLKILYSLLNVVIGNVNSYSLILKKYGAAEVLKASLEDECHPIVPWPRLL